MILEPASYLDTIEIPDGKVGLVHGPIYLDATLPASSFSALSRVPKRTSTIPFVIGVPLTDRQMNRVTEDVEWTRNLISIVKMCWQRCRNWVRFDIVSRNQKVALDWLEDKLSHHDSIGSMIKVIKKPTISAAFEHLVEHANWMLVPASSFAIAAALFSLRSRSDRAGTSQDSPDSLLF